jgi:hypothetical protein
MPWTGGSGGTSSDGAAGSDVGSDGPIEAGGPEPVWQEIGEAVGYIFDRVVNTSELRLFRWGPCKEGSVVVDGCESAEFLIPAFYGDELKVSPGSVVHDNGSKVFAGIVFVRRADYVIVFADQDGFVQEAFRARTASGPAAASHPAIWGSRYALLASRDMEALKVDGKHPGVFGTFNSSDQKVVALDTWGVMPFGASVVWSPLGEDRWFWNWAPQAAFVSFSSENGSDARVVYQQYEHPEVWSIGLPVTTGSHFLFTEDLVVNNQYESRVSITDGINPPVTYLTIGDGADVGTMCFAHSHVAWLQGTGFQDYNKYDHVELWASPYSPSPSELAPFKIADEPDHPSILGEVFGGHGYVAYGLFRPASQYRSFVIWNIASKTKSEHTLPSHVWARQPLAMTRNHYWMIGTQAHSDNDGDYLIRLRAEP